MVIQHLQTDFETLYSLVISLPEKKLLVRMSRKWTLKEVLVHMMDAERIFAYRALRIARNDKTNLPGFEQEEYTPYLYANERSIANIMEEYGLHGNPQLHYSAIFMKVLLCVLALPMVPH